MIHLQLYIDNKLVLEKVCRSNLRKYTADLMKDQYGYLLSRKPWAIYEVKQSRMNNPRFQDHSIEKLSK